MIGELDQRSKSRKPLGRSIEELTTARPVMMPPPDIFDADLAGIEGTLRSSVPEVIRKRIGVSRSLAVYGAFCYDFISVSAFWSLSCVEMALVWRQLLFPISDNYFSLSYCLI